MAPRRPRLLTSEEKLLWGEIAKLVTPLHRVAAPVRSKAAPAETSLSSLSRKHGVPPGSDKRRKTVLAPQGQRPVKLGDLSPKPQLVRAHSPALPYPPPAPAGPGLERRERRGLQRGLLPIEARIDLHGLYQAQAHAALVAFLMRARGAGLSRVLVVTGKGGSEEHAMFADRGVLRRSVPHWLRSAELRPVVLGFEEAARHHGGAGALYVRLKRR